MKLSEIMVENRDYEVVIDCEFDLLGMATSKFSGERVLCFLGDLKYLDSIIENQNIEGIICTRDISENIPKDSNLGILIADNPKHFFYEVHNNLAQLDFYWQNFNNEISSTALISDKALIGDNSIIIGENTLIEDGVVIHPGTIIGNNVIIRSGTQVGTNGFQFLKIGNEVISVKTAGKTIIKDNVEIQHNCCIDSGVFGGNTVIENNVKLDNLVHIAHDAYIGERTLITAGVVFGGRVTVGKDCWLGLNATVSNGITIGDNSRISLGAVVTRDVNSSETVTGNFAISHNKFIDFIKNIR